MRQAIASFREALAIDPFYAPAHVGIADSHSLLGSFLGESGAEHFPQAKAALRRALELDDSLAATHTSLAKMHMDVDRDWAATEREFKRAIELDPVYATAHHWYGNVFLSAMARHDEAIREVSRALELDPLSLAINADLAYGYLVARRYDEAILQARKTIEMNAQFWIAYDYLAIAYVATGRYAEAIAAYERMRGLEDAPEMSAAFAWVYAKAGRRAEATEMLADLKRRVENEENVAAPYDLAVIHAALGERDAAFARLEDEYHATSVALLSLKVDPLVDDLRNDARFTRLLERLHLA